MQETDIAIYSYIIFNRFRVHICHLYCVIGPAYLSIDTSAPSRFGNIPCEPHEYSYFC